jgi:hypothetical protein
MNCYVCATGGQDAPAVASCPNCHAGLCLEHVRRHAADTPGGLHLGCSHDTWSPAPQTTTERS